MDPGEYIQQRIDDQIEWYDTKSREAQLKFKCLRSLEIVAAAAIPFLIALADWPAIAPAVACLGALIVILSGFQSLGQYHQTWLLFRTTCEEVRREKLLYLTGTYPYLAEDRFDLLVKRVEARLAREHAGWLDVTRSAASRSFDEADAS